MIDFYVKLVYNSNNYYLKSTLRIAKGEKKHVKTLYWFSVFSFAIRRNL